MEVVTIREKMKEQRKLQNLTQRQLAKCLGIGQDLYSRYESGRLNIPISLVPDICYYLHCTPDELFEYERYKKRYHHEKEKTNQR